MFGLALLERLPGDVVLSPYSLQRALDTVRAGAAGATRAALDAVLGEPVPAVTVDDPAVVLRLAQAAWLAAGYTAGPALTLETGPLDPALVNRWAREQTGGMIRQIVERFAGDEIFALTDAAYLDAAWRIPFDAANTRPRPFAGAGEVAMMVRAGNFQFAEAGGAARAIRIPYGDGALRFVAALGVDGDWLGLPFQLGVGRVELPRFGADCTLKLTEPLTALGLGPAFAPGRDLERLISGPGGKALSRVDQRARVEVDERGTRAAAITTIGARRHAARVLPPFELVFDRPFRWAVEHVETGALLFLGRVLKQRDPKIAV
jgi:serine protease inhibitor